MPHRLTATALGIVWMGLSAVTVAGPHPDWVNSLKPGAEPAAELALASGGKTEYRVLLSAEPTTRDLKAAAELAKTLSLITGAEFPIVCEGQGGPAAGRVISVGRTARMREANLPQAKADLGDEGYAIAVKDGSLFIFGGRLRGPIYGVYAFLEEDLGCRWYVAAKAVVWMGRQREDRGGLGEPLLPHDADLRVRAVPRHFVPTLFLREPFYAEAFDPAWALQNRVNGHHTDVRNIWGGRVVYAPVYCHTFRWLVPPDRYFKTHPEYFMVGKDGKRKPHQICQSAPEVIRFVTEQALKALDKEPWAQILEVSPNDLADQYCRCPLCDRINKENNSPAGSLIYFVNKIAEGIEDKHPHVLVSTLAYVDTLWAPTKIRPRHNVTVRLCNDIHSWRRPLTCFATDDQYSAKEYRKAIQDWSKICKTLTIWDYCINFSHFLAPMPNMHVLKPSVDFYVKHNVRGIMFQGNLVAPGAERAPMRCWVMAKLFWDPSLDVDALMRDFVFGYYEQAAPQLWAYYELLEETLRVHFGDAANCGIRWDMNSPMYSRDFLDKATELFRLAEGSANRAAVGRRVQLAKLPLLYVKLMQGPGSTDEDYSALIDEFERIARREHVSALAEVGHLGSDLDKNLKAWRAKAAKAKP